MIDAVLTFLKLAPTIFLMVIGLRFIFDTEDFNLRRVYRRYIGKGDWRTMTRLLGILMVVAAILLGYFLVWPDVEAILNPEFVPTGATVR